MRSTRMPGTRTCWGGAGASSSLTDLGDDDPAGVVGGLGDGQHLAEQALFVHDQVAERVGGGRPDQADVDRNRLVPEPGSPAEFDALDQAGRRPRVESAALHRRIDEGAQADVGDAAGPAGGDVAEELQMTPWGKL